MKLFIISFVFFLYTTCGDTQTTVVSIPQSYRVYDASYQDLFPIEKWKIRNRSLKQKGGN